MFQSLHALERELHEQRREIERTMGHRQIGVASCAVLDELIARSRRVTDVVPADAKITLSRIKNHSDDALAVMQLVPATLRKMGDLINESGEAVHAARQPLNRLIGRIESEGYRVDLDTLTEVTDAANWSVLDGLDDPDLRVQLEAEKVARAEQAAVYQKRLERMDAAIRGIETGYAQRVRELATLTLGT